MNFLPTHNDKYTWFYYLGILFFISNLVLFGFGFQISYFGIVLILLGLYKPVLSGWFTTLLYIFIFIEIYMDILLFRAKYFTKKDSSTIKKPKQKIENKKSNKEKFQQKNK